MLNRHPWLAALTIALLPLPALAEVPQPAPPKVYDVLVSAEGHLRAVAYYHYDWSLKDGSNVAFDCADVFNFDPDTGRIESIVLVYDTRPVRDVVENKYP